VTYAEKLRAEYLQAIADCMAAAGQPVKDSTLDPRAHAHGQQPNEQGHRHAD
jgi:hypothetical protein